MITANQRPTEQSVPDEYQSCVIGSCATSINQCKREQKILYKWKSSIYELLGRIETGVCKAQFSVDDILHIKGAERDQISASSTRHDARCLSCSSRERQQMATELERLRRQIPAQAISALMVLH